MKQTCPSGRTAEKHRCHVELRLDGIEASARYARRVGGGWLIW